MKHQGNWLTVCHNQDMDETRMKAAYTVLNNFCEGNTVASDDKNFEAVRFKMKLVKVEITSLDTATQEGFNFLLNYFDGLRTKIEAKNVADVEAQANFVPATNL